MKDKNRHRKSDWIKNSKLFMYLNYPISISVKLKGPLFHSFASFFSWGVFIKLIQMHFRSCSARDEETSRSIISNNN